MQSVLVKGATFKLKEETLEPKRNQTNITIGTEGLMNTQPSEKGGNDYN